MTRGSPESQVTPYSAPRTGFGHGHAVPVQARGSYGSSRGTAGGVTAISAAVSAVVVSLATAVGAVMTFRGLGASACLSGTFAQAAGVGGECLAYTLRPPALVYLIACTAVGLLLLVGAVLLFARTTAGRVLVVVAAALAALIGVATSVTGSDSLTAVFGLVIGLTPAALAVFPLVCAAAPATGRWIHVARR